MSHLFWIVKADRDREASKLAALNTPERNEAYRRQLDREIVSIFNDAVAYMVKHKTCRVTLVRDTDRLVSSLTPFITNALIDVMEARLRVMFETAHGVVVESFYVRYNYIGKVNVDIELNPGFRYPPSPPPPPQADEKSCCVIS